MKRRLNYTGRKKINRDKIGIALYRNEGMINSFSAKLDLAGMSLPEDAKVYVVTYHSTDQKRFDFGTVGEVIIPRNTNLEDLAHAENLKFRVLVVDETGEQGLILAHADRISPLPEEKNKSILPVYFKDIGQQIWKIEYKEDGGGPSLVLNSRIPNIQSLAKTDQLFFFFVYPAVIKEVLTHIIFVNGGDSVEDPTIEWQGDWLRFAVKIVSGEAPPSNISPDNGDESMQWIDRVVEEFCSSRKGWSQLVNKLIGGETA